MNQKGKILIVDDEEVIHVSLSRLLEDAGYCATTADSGLIATQKIENYAFDVILTDLVLAEMDGYSVIEFTRDHAPDTPVIVLTGHGSMESAIQAMRAGAYDYLTKPCEPEELLLAIERGLEWKAMKQRQRDLELELIKKHNLAAIGMLTSGIAHNLNNFLTGILGYAHLLKGQPFPQSRYVDQIIKAAGEMAKIIKTLLRKGQQDQASEKQCIDLNELLQTELELLEGDMVFRQEIQKEYDFASEPSLIEGVYRDISQSFLNIIRNAIDAMHESEVKRLTVKTRNDGDNIVVSVSDTGCGIPAENLPTLFHPFFTTKPSLANRTKNEPTGTGLGLWSAYQLLIPYHAQFDVKSKPGKGTTFTVKIPIGH